MTKWGELKSGLRIWALWPSTIGPLDPCPNGEKDSSHLIIHQHRDLKADTRGVTIVEFAFVAPIFLMLLFGIFDITYTVYAKSILDGAVQTAGRNSALETATSNVNAIDDRVRDIVKSVVPRGEFTFQRRNFHKFSDIGGMEDELTTEERSRDVCPSGGDGFWDENGDGVRGAKLGQNGLGAGDDVVLYTVTVEYNRIFPLWAFIGGSSKGHISATTTLRNQPYSDQSPRTVELVCL
jgi:hypothetical protein